MLDQRKQSKSDVDKLFVCKDKSSQNIIEVDEYDPDDAEEKGDDSDPDKQPFSLLYAFYCHMLLSIGLSSCIWNRAAMPAFYGFGIAGKLDDPFYAMQKDTIGLDSKTYADYCGISFTITFIPCLLFAGPIIADWPQVRTFGVCLTLQGILICLHGSAQAMWELLVYSFTTGILQGISAAIVHQ